MPENLFTAAKDAILSARKFSRIRARYELLQSEVSEKLKQKLEEVDNPAELSTSSYVAGVKFGGRLSADEAKTLHREIEVQLARRIGTFYDTEGPSLQLYKEGLLIELSLPIVDIPEMRFDESGITPDKIRKLHDLRRNVARSGSVMLQISIMPVSSKSGFMKENENDIPELLKIEDDLDYKLEIVFTPPFSGQRETAGSVLNAIMMSSTIGEKRRASTLLQSDTTPKQLSGS